MLLVRVETVGFGAFGIGEDSTRYFVAKVSREEGRVLASNSAVWGPPFIDYGISDTGCGDFVDCRVLVTGAYCRLLNMSGRARVWT